MIETNWISARVITFSMGILPYRFSSLFYEKSMSNSNPDNESYMLITEIFSFNCFVIRHFVKNILEYSAES